MCVKFPPKDLNPDPYPHILQYLYLWNDHRTNGI